MFAAAGGTGQSCFVSPLFQKCHYSSVRSQCPASGSTAPAPPLCLPLLMFPPSKWATRGQAHTTRSLLPCSLPGSLYQVCRAGARQEAQASNVLDNSSRQEGRSQLEPGSPACLQTGPACSGRRELAPLTMGVRHFWHKSQCQDG